MKLVLSAALNLRPVDSESHPSICSLDGRQTLVTNKAENICVEICNATDRDYSKKLSE